MIRHNDAYSIQLSASSITHAAERLAVASVTGKSELDVLDELESIEASAQFILEMVRAIREANNGRPTRQR